MKKHPSFPPKQPFQSLETFESIFPIIGNFFKLFSNHWKLFKSIFQPLETLSFALLFSFFIFHFSLTSSAAPMPSFSYHGQITTENGTPYPADDQATLIIKTADRIISRTAIQRAGVAGCNYLAEIPLDSDISAYREYALRTGAAVSFALIDASNCETALYPITPIPAVGRPGTTARLDLSAGEDSIGDGLTDAFRQRIADASYGQLTNLAQVLPEDDFDGDGMSNLDEFRSATDPTWSDDVLQVAQFRPVQGRIAFEFFAVEGIAYSICGASETDADGRFIWSRVPWSLSPDAPFTDTLFTGRGGPATLYLSTDQPVKLFKLTVE